MSRSPHSRRDCSRGHERRLVTSCCGGCWNEPSRLVGFRTEGKYERAVVREIDELIHHVQQRLLGGVHECGVRPDHATEMYRAFCGPKGP